MVFNQSMPTWCIITCFLGLTTGFFSSSVVMFSLIKLPFKDISTELRKYSTISDILMIAMFCFIFFSDNTQKCMENYLFAVSFNLHAYWVFYMSYLMHRIIYLKKSPEKAHIKYVYVFLTLLSASMSATIFINTHQDLCDLPHDWPAFYYLLFALCIPHLLILILIIVYYWHIRKALIVEIDRCDDIATQKRNLFKRLFGYPVIFFMISMTFVLVAIEFAFPQTIETLEDARLILSSYYPLINSMLYGFTQSSKRVLRYVISNDFEYNREEDILHELRKEDFILPRFYLDLIDETEDRIFPKS